MQFPLCGIQSGARVLAELIAIVRASAQKKGFGGLGFRDLAEPGCKKGS